MKDAKAKIKKLAERRIRKLFQLAKKEEPALAKRYIRLAREIARKTQTKIPIQLKRSFCKKCNLPFTKATKVRIKNGFIIYTCVCGAKRRFKVKRK
ncbi:ribonuclease P [Candidatus Pacearchaeota archaeon ex4484_26]|nr:MAG: ribonuclease P [Candidatus Pacearchaeota archaeon ex4484_26]